MSSKTLFVFMSDAEVTTAKASEYYVPDEHVFLVAKTNAYSLPKKLNPVNATVDDFAFQYSAQMKELFQDNEIDNVVCNAAHTLEGLYWLGHWGHWLSKDSDGIFKYRLQTYIMAGHRSWFHEYADTPGSIAVNEERSRYETPSETYLRELFYFYVHNTITSSLMYKTILKPLAGTLLKSKKSALSVGMYRCLAAFASFSNPRCLHLQLPNTDASGQAVDGNYMFDPYEAISTVSKPISKHAFKSATDLPMRVSMEPRTQLDQTVADPFTLRKHDGLPGDSKTNLIEAYDPYVSCLLTNIPIRKYFDLIHTGTLSVAAHPMLPVDNTHNRENIEFITKYFRELECAEVLPATASETLLANYTAVGGFDVFKSTFVLQRLTEKIADSFEYSILYDRYQTRSLVRFCQFPETVAKKAAVNIKVVYGDFVEHCNILTRSIPVVSVTSRDQLGWLNMIDPAAVLKTPLHEIEESGISEIDVPYVPSISDNPSYTAQVFNVLECTYGMTPSYVYALIRSLVRKRYLSMSQHGVRITAYGYAVVAAYQSALPTKITNKLDAIHCGLCDQAASIVRGGRADHAETYALELQKAKGLLQELAVHAKSWKGVTVTVKRKKKSPSGSVVLKRVKYRLHVDRKTKQAWFETRKHKKTFVYAKILNSLTVNIGACSGTSTMLETKLIPGPQSYLKSEVVESACPECGNLTYSYKKSPDAQLMLHCVNCNAERQAPFRIELNTEFDPFHND